MDSGAFSNTREVLSEAWTRGPLRGDPLRDPDLRDSLRELTITFFILNLTSGLLQPHSLKD